MDVTGVVMINFHAYPRNLICVSHPNLCGLIFLSFSKYLFTKSPITKLACEIGLRVGHHVGLPRSKVRLAITKVILSPWICEGPARYLPSATDFETSISWPNTWPDHLSQARHFIIAAL